jgi:hypothetical protein
MNRLMTRVLLCGIALFEPGQQFIGSAWAQTEIMPLPEPQIDPAPGRPSNAQQVYDQVTIEQIMKSIILLRTIGGGIDKLLGAVLDKRPIPLFNGPAEAAAREGGPGLKAMVDSVTEGEFVGPEGIRNALAEYRKTLPAKNAGAVSPSIAQALLTLAVADEGYRRSNLSMGRLDDYLKTLEASADLKTSVDLNTRVMIELTQQANENARLQASTASIMSFFLFEMSGSGADPYSEIKSLIEKYR